MARTILPAALCAGAVLLLAGAPAAGHAVIGDRLFPSTLGIDDPSVADEASLPTFTRSIDAGGTVEHDVGFDLQKTITPKLAVFVGDAYSHFSDGTSGLQNLELGVKYALYGNVEHELLVAVGVAAEVGGTGNPAFANRFSSLGPQLYVGKGFGDLPRSLDLLRPFALTGQVGFAIPTRSSSPAIVTDPDNPTGLATTANATVLNWGFSLQYSLLYLNNNIGKLADPEFFGRLIPTVEVALRSPIANIPQGGHTTLGTVQPGIFYERDAYQLGVEALLPINGASGKHAGVVAQLHVFFEDIFPTTLGRPLFGGEEGEGGHHDHGAAEGTEGGHGEGAHTPTHEHAADGEAMAANGH